MTEKTLEESPHVEYLKGKFIDFKRELQKNWLTKLLPAIFKNNKGKEEEISKNLINNVGFMNFFKRDFMDLNSTLKNKLRETIPKVFWKTLPQPLLASKKIPQEPFDTWVKKGKASGLQEKKKKGDFFKKDLDKLMARQALNVSSGMAGWV